ncbi:hypothetical protein [Embleya scabrispora]|uniref:hypothetical protein n=1 Tax=Embleya scabrispora TaxID=159449 RepID=UPI0003A07EE3|nr:hypothetical protein [Embleya scabrispora]MYS85798.1 hypothetical protein [Streptomyces sp. SID5474]
MNSTASRVNGDDTTTATTPSRQLGVYNASPRGPQSAATGVTFDVIAVDAPLGLAALRLLHERAVPLGAVIHDHRRHRIGFLVPPRSEGSASDVEPGAACVRSGRVPGSCCPAAIRTPR